MKDAQLKETRKPNETRNQNLRQQTYKNKQLSAQQQNEFDEANNINTWSTDQINNLNENLLSTTEKFQSSDLQLPQELDLKHFQSLIFDIFSKLRYQFASIQHEVVELKALNSHILKILLESRNMGYGPTQELQLPIPFTTMDEFEAFDLRSAEDTAFKSQIKKKISTFTLVSNPLVKSVSRVIASFFTRDVICQFTPIKDLKKKKVYKSTNFYSCLLEVIEAEFQENPDAGKFKIAQFDSVLGKVLNNARD